MHAGDVDPRRQRPHLIVVRHGERADKYEHLLPRQEPHNPSLTDVGFAQAAGVGTLLRAQYGEHTKWRVISSPFLRTIQSSANIMRALGPSLHSGVIEIDFELSEHIVGSEVPRGVVDLTELSAAEIAKRHVQDVSVRFAYGDASHVPTRQTLTSSGARMMSALNRIYDDHVARAHRTRDDTTSDDDAASQPQPSLLIVTHGFAHAQLMRMIYGYERMVVSRVYLCAMVHLRRLGPVDLGDESGGAVAVKNRSPFAACWTRGVTWRWHTETAHDSDSADHRDGFVDEADGQATWYEGVVVQRSVERFYLAYPAEPVVAPPQSSS